MKFSSKIRIDHTIGRLLCFALFPLVRSVGLLLRRDHSIHQNNVKSIVVSKYYGMGSIIHATPMLRILKNTFPNASLIFVTRKENEALLDHYPDIDEVLIVNDSSLTSLVFSSGKLVTNLIRQRIDLFFDLELFSAYGALVSLFSLARNRIGFLCGLDADFKSYLYTHLIYFNFHMPVRICYLQLARMAGGEARSTNLIKPFIEEDLREAALKKLDMILPDKKNKDRRLLAININVTEVSLERKWLPERFEAVARHFANLGFEILFVGSPKEYQHVQEVVGRMDDISHQVHNIAGKFSLSEFLAVLEMCDVLLTTDTGIMNFAYALDVPTVSLWGPDTPSQYHVDKPHTHAIWKSAYCSPCIYRFSVPPCGGDNVCMRLITVDEVIFALTNILNGQARQEPDEVSLICVDENSNPLGLIRK